MTATSTALRRDALSQIEQAQEGMTAMQAQTAATAAPKHLPAGTGPTLRVITDLVTFKARSTDTNGAYSLFEDRTQPQGGTPPHIHEHEEEAYFVLEGTYSYCLGDETVVFGPGGFVLVPRGTVHSFTNVGDAPARQVIITSPGVTRLHEGLFEAVGEPIENPASPPPPGPLDAAIAKVLAAAPKYGMVVLPPPGQ